MDIQSIHLVAHSFIQSINIYLLNAHLFQIQRTYGFIRQNSYLQGDDSLKQDTKGKKKKIQMHVVSFVFLDCVLMGGVIM